MTELPTLYTECLILRPHSLWDADDLQKLIEDKDIASTTFNLPYPYTLEDAIEFIGQREEKYEETGSPEFAITHKDGYFIGGIGMRFNKEHENGKIGYWIGKPYWGKGFCTEAACAVVKYGFEVLGLNRIHAAHMTRNPASGRVMQKIGMKHEGHLRQDKKKWDKFEDMELYGMLRSEYFANP
ncbi:MAG: GNAT family N-acetyltransferase [Dehalococcoidales bacterium]|nr:GNAT family N-acetyltransferase [Dehalococcoidales bacterium]